MSTKATSNELKNQLANRQGNNAATNNNPANTIAAYLKRMAPEIEKALPAHMDADRLARIALTTIRTTPKLLECTIPSLMGAVMQSAQLGLEPGLIGHCYIIPYGKEATFIIGYKGMIDLARRSGNIESIYAHAVYKNDEFEYEYGLKPNLVHKPAMSDQGDFIGAYAVAHFKDGGYQFEFMPKEEIDKRRNRSAASKGGPWVTDYEEMAKKTVVRHMWKYLPISIEIQQAATQDEVVRKDITEDPMPVDVLDIPFEASDAEETSEEGEINFD
ncbi:recombinase RecT [Ammoniphilus oxalaticus]|uniref:Recombinase RecT n=1 Tax=Ammoniphilus oxalaticus TaxID=66863 RepID=A0A419SD10_9BACL|nr:recombination protein RecT [Ammoniphilus oxalaticus]RKD20988.1 recombinase RecT [Ammoniphilus oxalaticus]